MASNTIEVRRIGQENQRSGDAMQQLAKQTATDSREMKRLAYLNMAFLPSAIVAVYHPTLIVQAADSVLLTYSVGYFLDTISCT